MQPRVTLMKTEGAFCLSALPSHAALSTLPFQQWRARPPTPLLLESCQQQAPLDGDMQILSLETSQPVS